MLDHFIQDIQVCGCRDQHCWRLTTTQVWWCTKSLAWSTVRTWRRHPRCNVLPFITFLWIMTFVWATSVEYWYSIRISIYFNLFSCYVYDYIILYTKYTWWYTCRIFGTAGASYCISVLSLPRSRMCWDTFLGPNANNHRVMETPFG